MTVTYEDTLRGLLFRWKASVWRIVYKDLIVFCVCYFTISFVYRFALNSSQRELFENTVHYTNDVSKTFITILSLLLGFYVSHMVSRWWLQFQLLPWPDELMGHAALVIRGTGEEEVMLRENVARYFCASVAIAGRLFCAPLKQRYPEIGDIVKGGLLTEEELEVYENTNKNSRWFLPINWIQAIFEEEAKKRFPPPVQAALLLRAHEECNKLIIQLRQLFCYDWINMPMVYTQVVAIATYSYFATCIIGRQFLSPEREEMRKIFKSDHYVPVFTLLQLIFYVGWFRVGQNLMKPFGFDDEDFEMSILLDRNIQASFALAKYPGSSRTPYTDVPMPQIETGKIGDTMPPIQGLEDMDLDDVMGKDKPFLAGLRHRFQKRRQDEHHPGQPNNVEEIHLMETSSPDASTSQASP